jgi:hypothetical protein
VGFVSRSRTRLAGGISLLALAAVTVSDFLLTDFWDRNAMATSVVADVFVLIVGVAVVNEFLAARSRSQWQLVADYALVELSRSCRHVWVELTQGIGVGRREEITRDELRDLALSQEGYERAAALAETAAGDAESRRRLYELTSKLASETGSALTSWAPVLLETPEAAALNRYVELQAILAELDLALWEEAEGRRATFEGTANPSWIGARISSLIRLGSDLEGELRASARAISRELGLGRST